MVLWIGVDDTDSLEGMCTTFLATEIVAELSQDYDLIGFPRLVRLNPNIPWKTRGNGAICLRFGSGHGPESVVGVIKGRPVRSFARVRGRDFPGRVLSRVERLIERYSEFADPMTNPGFCVLPEPPSPALYWKAVRRIVTKEEAIRAVRGAGFLREYKNGRGIIGALAAAAWRPRDRTYEVLCYRDPDRWGTPRLIEAESVKEMDQAFPSTFNNYDYESNHVVIAPHSPCPVLFGIRGDDPGILPAAMNTVEGERAERWLIFETNQGTDDHVMETSSPQPGNSTIVSGTVRSHPRTISGGHVVFRLEHLDVTTYEPSKQFRSVVRGLVPGDRIQAIGAVRRRPKTLNLEKLFVGTTVGVSRKVSNPWCSSCKKRAKSLGHRAGFRCARCGKRFPESAAIVVPVERSLRPGWYEPPPGSRRHLAKPLKRLQSSQGARPFPAIRKDRTA